MTDSLRISLEDYRARSSAGERFTFIDTRNPSAWEESDLMIPGAIRVPANELEQYLSEIPKNRTIITYCT